VGQSIVIANQFAMKFNCLLNAVASLPIVFADPSLNSELAFYQIIPKPPSSRGILSPPPLALLYDFAQIRNRPYLIRSQLHAWMLRDKLNGMIEVSRLKDEKAGELFLGFRIGAVGRRDFSVFPVLIPASSEDLTKSCDDVNSKATMMMTVRQVCSGTISFFLHNFTR